MTSGYSDRRSRLTATMAAFADETASGKSAKQIAAERHVSVATVHAVRQAAVRRAGARNLYELVAMRARGDL